MSIVTIARAVITVARAGHIVWRVGATIQAYQREIQRLESEAEQQRMERLRTEHIQRSNRIFDYTREARAARNAAKLQEQDTSEQARPLTRKERRIKELAEQYNAQVRDATLGRSKPHD